MLSQRAGMLGVGDVQFVVSAVTPDDQDVWTVSVADQSASERYVHYGRRRIARVVGWAVLEFLLSFSR